MPFASSIEDAWLLVWITRPPGRQPDAFERHTREYLRLKMHQLGFPRGVAFCFGETTRDLVGVYFDDHVGELDPGLAARLHFLKPPEQTASWQPPGGKTRPGSKTHPQRKRSKKSKRR
jgi:hypothetical protein